MGYLPACTWVVVVLSSVELYLLPQASTERDVWAPDVIMPRAWDIRYVQRSALEGVQVWLLRRGQNTGDWLALTPTLGVHLLSLGDRRSVRTFAQGPKVGVHYTAGPVLSNQQKAEHMAEAERVYAGGMVGITRIGNAEGNTRAWLTRYVGFMLTSPAWGLKVIKWSCKSPWRFGGWVGIMWGCYELATVVGTFESLKQGVEAGYVKWLMLK